MFYFTTKITNYLDIGDITPQKQKEEPQASQRVKSTFFFNT
ncbi:hypothetical protein HMPREF1869_00939 [Bacteroidales bacterium KA00251]|nr:hypothetical protein HMPREF1869_00939 [Bacteroidales bacterium KA00251]